MAKGERSPKALAQFDQNICKEGNFWLLLTRQFGIIGSFSSASMLWDDSRCARWEPIRTPPPLKTMVEEYNILSNQDVYKPEMLAHTEDG
jgi:hypothetical protein